MTSEMHTPVAITVPRRRGSTRLSRRVDRVSGPEHYPGRGNAYRESSPLLDWNSDCSRKAAAEVLPSGSLSPEHLGSVEPGIGCRRFGSELRLLDALHGDDGPELAETLAFCLLVRLLSFACAIVRVAAVRPALDLDRNLVVGLLTELLLEANIRIGGQCDVDASTGSVLNHEALVVSRLDVIADYFEDGEEDVKDR